MHLNYQHLPLSDLAPALYDLLQTSIAAWTDIGTDRDQIPDFEVLKSTPGFLIWAWEGEECVGITLCWGGKGFGFQHLSPLSYANEYWFLQELVAIGHFQFIKFVGVAPTHRRSGVASALLMKLEEQAKNQGAMLLAAVVHEANFNALQLMDRAAFNFIDHFRTEAEKELRYRTVKVLDLNRYYRSVNSQTLYQASRTLIPMHLNLACQDINSTLERLDAKLTWASFFQLSPLLSREFGMKKVYNGHYHSLLTRSPGAFSKGVQFLKEVLDYFDENEVEGITTISQMLLKNAGLKFFIYLDQGGTVEFPSFVNPLVLNLNTVTVEGLRGIPEFKLGEKLTVEEVRAWKHCLDRKANKKDRTQKDEAEWDSWVETLELSPLEQERAITLTHQRFNHAPLETEETQWLDGLWKRGRHASQKMDNAWNDWIQLHKKLCSTDLQAFEGDWIWCHSVIPLSYSGGLSGLMFSIMVRRQDNVAHLLNDIARTVMNACAQPMLNIVLKARDHVIKKYWAQSMVSTIMTRNLSHNIGSHILSNLFSSSWDASLPLQAAEELLYMEDLGNFIHYLRTRMDFLADISTSYPVTASAHQLKREVIEKFNSQEIVIKYISGTRLKELKIRFENKEHPGQDISVQLPNGSIGFHAFFVIVENIIRNCAKHDHPYLIGRESLEITVAISGSTADNRYFKIQVSDNLPRPKKAYLYTGKTLPQWINQEYIYPPLFKKDLEVRASGWGVLEMKIAAAYLRKIAPANLDNVFNYPLLRAIEVPGKEPETFHLGYEFFLKKPREVLVIDAQYQLHSHLKSQHLSTVGIRVTNPQMLASSFQSFYSHELVLLLGTGNRKKLEREKTYPLRWIQVDGSQEMEVICKQLLTSPAQFILSLWKQWLHGFCQRKGLAQPPTVLVARIPHTEGLDGKTHPLDQIALFDFHGETAAQTELEVDELLFYEQVGSVTPLGKLLRNLPDAPQQVRERITLELQEAAVTEVLILDERIQAALRQITSAHPDSPLNQLARKNIHVPDPEEIDLATDIHHSEKVLTWIQERLAHDPVDFLLIHLGIIEKIVGTDNAAIERFMREEILTHNPRTEVVVTSGRGKPHFISKSTLFLHYSNIARFVVEDPSKYHLCKILFSARTRIQEVQQNLRYFDEN